MENFGTLLESMSELRAQYEQEKLKKRSNKRPLLALESRVKTLKQRIDSFGSKDSILRVDLQVKLKSSALRSASIYLVGVAHLTPADMHSLLRWKCSIQGLEFVAIIDQQLISTGIFGSLQK
jgi:hypothetical protein